MASPNEEAQQVSISIPIPLWRNRSYLLLVGGQAISEVGTEVSALAYTLLILALTHSPAQVGLVGVLELLPVLLLSLHAGALIDRWDRKRVMILCGIGRAICLASVVLALALGRLTIVQIYLVALSEATLSVFFNHAERACLRNVVPREQLSTASAQNQTITYTSAFIGPTVSGALYTVGQVFPFLQIPFHISSQFSRSSSLRLRFKSNVNQHRNPCRFDSANIRCLSFTHSSHCDVKPSCSSCSPTIRTSGKFLKRRLWCDKMS